MELNRDNYFDWKFYINEYPLLFLKTEHEALEHWKSFGEKNNYLPNKFFKMHQDFNWKNYVNNYDDIKRIDNKRDAFIHYINIGLSEGKSYKIQNNYRFIKEGKKIRALVKKKNQGDIIIKDDNEITLEEEKEKILQKLYKSYEENNELLVKIRESDEKNCQLTNKLNEQKLQIETQQTEIDKLYKINQDLTNKINHFEDKNNDLYSSNIILNKKNNILNSQISKLATKNNELRNDIYNLLENKEKSIMTKEVECQFNNEIKNLSDENMKYYYENIIEKLEKDIQKEKQLNVKLYQKLFNSPK